MTYIFKINLFGKNGPIFVLRESKFPSISIKISNRLDSNYLDKN